MIQDGVKVPTVLDLKDGLASEVTAESLSQCLLQVL